MIYAAETNFWYEHIQKDFPMICNRYIQSRKLYIAAIQSSLHEKTSNVKDCDNDYKIMRRLNKDMCRNSVKSNKYTANNGHYGLRERVHKILP